MLIFCSLAARGAEGRWEMALEMDGGGGWLGFLLRSSVPSMIEYPAGVSTKLMAIRLRLDLEFLLLLSFIQI